MHRQRAADDFATIRARMEELRREREATSDEPVTARDSRLRRAETDPERRRRERMEGFPPPWVPTIFVKKHRP